MKKISITLIISILLLGCNGSEQTQLPNQSFSDNYTLADFTLNNEYRYWEIRQGMSSFDNNDYSADNKGHSVLQKFDEDKYAQLTSEQLSRLDKISADNGYDASCYPDYCPIYGVAVLTDSFFVIESESDLITFFEEIDTAAELYVYLSKAGSTAKSYQKNALGYKALVSWDNLCGTRGENLVQVFTDGTVEVIQELSVSEYDGCY